MRTVGANAAAQAGTSEAAGNVEAQRSSSVEPKSVADQCRRPDNGATSRDRKATSQPATSRKASVQEQRPANKGRSVGLQSAAKATRRDALIKALKRKRALTAGQLADLLNLQEHSVRAAISGLRKSGVTVMTEKWANGTTYRIETVPLKETETGRSSEASPCHPSAHKIQ